MKTSHKAKKKVILVVLGFSLFLFGGLPYTFIKSTRMDTEHVEITEITEKVQIDVLLATIGMDEFYLYGDTSLVKNIYKNFKNAEDHLSSINTKIRSHKLRKSKSSSDDFIRKLNEVRANIKILDRVTTKDIQVNSRNHNTDIKKVYLNFNKNFGEFEAELHNYIIRSNSKFKKELCILLISSFLILLFCIYIILHLINKMIQADLQIIKKTIEIEQKERHRISMDLHDGMGSLLSSIGLYIKLLQVEKFDNKEIIKKLHQLRQLSDQTFENFEEVINNLNPACLNKYGLVRSLENLCNEINNTGEIYFELQVENLHYNLSKSTEAILYRICNELINNTLKHSGAKTAKIDLSIIKNMVSLRFMDDGIGFNPVIDYYQKGGKTGLKNLASRVESLGGTYRMESSPNQGVDILIQFKITQIKTAIHDHEKY